MQGTEINAYLYLIAKNQQMQTFHGYNNVLSRIWPGALMVPTFGFPRDWLMASVTRFYVECGTRDSIARKAHLDLASAYPYQINNIKQRVV